MSSLYVDEPQQNLRQESLEHKAALNLTVIFTGHSNAVLLRGLFKWSLFVRILFVFHCFVKDCLVSVSRERPVLLALGFCLFT